jgi:tetratricopeptide (TPR) repeat protein
VGLVTLATEARSFVGTEGFIAPEGPGTSQADLYSLGIVLYVISTGKSHQDFPEPLSDLAAQRDHIQRLEFDAIVYKACQAEPAERYQKAQQMRDELLLLQRGQSVKRKRAAQHRWALGKKVGLAIIALALLVPALHSIKHHHTPTLEAQIAYKNGLWFYNKLTPEDHKLALTYLKRAVQLDPKYVEPYGPLTAIQVWGLHGESGRYDGQDQSQNASQSAANAIPDPWNGGRTWYSLLKSREIAKKALAIDPNAAEGHTALSWCKFLDRDWRGAEDEIVRAIKLNPKYPIARYLYSFYLTVQGRTEDAHRQVKRSLELDPTSRTSAVMAAWPFMAERRFDEAIAQLQRVIELDKNFPQTHSFLGRCYEAQRKYPEAIREYKASDLLNGEDPAIVEAAYTALQQAYDTGGEEGLYKKWIELIQADRSIPPEKRLFSDLDLAGCYARLGEKQKALDVLEKYYDWQLKFEPLYDTLHDEPRFKALLKKAGL